jgi:RNA polymerase sigma-70 factor (ECF subfamily)
LPNPTDDSDRALDHAVEAGRSAWPGVDLSREDFACAASRHRPADEPLAEWLAGLRVPDLYLASACAMGDAAALKLLDEQILSRIGATVHRIDPSPAFIDETKQELRVHLLVARPNKPPRIADYAGRGSLAGWIHVAAARIALTMKRASGGRHTTLSSNAGMPDDRGRHDAEILYLRERYREDLQAAFEETLGELTSRQRNILRMHFIDGTPLDRLATIYGMHRTTLGRWVSQTCDEILSSARKRLGARVQLPGGAMDSIVALLRSEIDFSASLLLSDVALGLDEEGDG